MASNDSQDPKHAEQLKSLEPKADQVKGGRKGTLHPAKVTVPDIKLS